MTDYTIAPKIVQEILLVPNLSTSLALFCKNNKIPSNVTSLITEYIEDFLCGTLSIADCSQKLKLECSIDDETLEKIMTIVGEVAGIEVMNIVLGYPQNKDFAPQGIEVAIHEQQVSPSAQLSIPQVIRPDNRSIRDRLFDALAPFTLHVDEQAVIAKEVERYVKGETRAIDVGAHIAAMIDKPVSMVSKIIESLNTHIFIPLKKQIVEEKAHDLHNSDEALTAALLGKPAKKSSTPLSFVPPDLLHTIEQKRKEEIFSDLRSVGGTPSGTSLLSQEINKEQKVSENSDTKDQTSIQIMPKKGYVVDPYREIM